MNKIKMILVTVVPFMEMGAVWLEMLDANTTGADDKAAKAIRVAIAAIKELANDKTV